MIRFCLALSVVALLPRLPSPFLCVLLLIPVLCARRFSFARTLMPVFAGFLWGLLFGYWGLAHRLPADWQGIDLKVEGVVIGLPRQGNGVCRFDLRLRSIAPVDIPAITSDTSPLRESMSPRRVRLSWYRCPKPVQSGAGYQLLVRLKQPHGYRNPSGGDRQRAHFSAGVDATGYVRKLLQVQPSAVLSPGYARSRISDLIASQLPTPLQRGVLQALLVGDKRGLTPPLWQLYRDSGVVHLLVISGLHIGMVAGAVWLLVSGIGRLAPATSLRRRKGVAAVAAISVALLYSVLSGFSLPAQRALIMVTVLLLGSVLPFRASAGSRCWLALTLVLMIDPLAVLSPGFWLSFGATAVLIYTLGGRQGYRSAVGQLVLVQLAVFTVIVPLSAGSFFQAALSAPLVNLLAVPVVSLLVLPLALLSLLLLPVLPELGGPGLSAAGWLLEQGTWLLTLLQQSVGYVWKPPALTVPAVALALLGSLILLMPAGMPGRWLGLLLWLPLLVGQEDRPEPAAFRLTVLDVGQGLSVFIETAEHRLLFDTGPGYRSGYSAAAAAIGPFLKGRGYDQLDRLIVSHGDNDHAGGLGYLRREFAIDSLLTGAGNLSAGIGRCHAGQRWIWDGVTFSILHPASAAEMSETSENNRSCVLKISSPAGSALIGADIEAGIEKRLVRQLGAKLRSQLLVVPHHGSLSSSSEAFIDQILPRTAIFSSGYRNSFGHPHPRVVARYRARGVQLFNTADSGAVQADFREGVGLSVRGYRQQYGRYWWNGQQ